MKCIHITQQSSPFGKLQTQSFWAKPTRKRGKLRDLNNCTYLSARAKTQLKQCNKNYFSTIVYFEPYLGCHTWLG
jgi:hypothetical protein